MNTETKNNNEPERAPAEKSAPTLAELQVQTTLAINRLQHLENALGEITHLRRKIYDLTDSRAKVARHAAKLAELLRRIVRVSPKLRMPVDGLAFSDTLIIGDAKNAIADFERSAR